MNQAPAAAPPRPTPYRAAPRGTDPCDRRAQVWNVHLRAAWMSASVAADELLSAGALISSVQISRHGVTITLVGEPPAGTVTGEEEVKRLRDGITYHLTRGHVGTVAVEWGERTA